MLRVTLIQAANLRLLPANVKNHAGFTAFKGAWDAGCGGGEDEVQLGLLSENDFKVTLLVSVMRISVNAAGAQVHFK